MLPSSRALSPQADNPPFSPPCHDRQRLHHPGGGVNAWHGRGNLRSDGLGDRILHLPQERLASLVEMEAEVVAAGEVRRV